MKTHKNTRQAPVPPGWRTALLQTVSNRATGATLLQETSDWAISLPRSLHGCQWVLTMALRPCTGCDPASYCLFSFILLPGSFSAPGPLHLPLLLPALGLCTMLERSPESFKSTKCHLLRCWIETPDNSVFYPPPYFSAFHSSQL